MPTSKKRAGKRRRNSESPVPSAMAAVMTATLGSRFPISQMTLENTSVYVSFFFSDTGFPVLISKGPVPWKRAGSCSAGS